MITDKQKSQFEVFGFLVVKQMFSPEECYPAATISNEYADESRLLGIRENLENRPHQTSPYRRQQAGPAPYRHREAAQLWIHLPSIYRPSLSASAVDFLSQVIDIEYCVVRKRNEIAQGKIVFKPVPFQLSKQGLANRCAVSLELDLLPRRRPSAPGFGLDQIAYKIVTKDAQMHRTPASLGEVCHNGPGCSGNNRIDIRTYRYFHAGDAESV